MLEIGAVCRASLRFSESQCERCLGCQAQWLGSVAWTRTVVPLRSSESSESTSPGPAVRLAIFGGSSSCPGQ